MYIFSKIEGFRGRNLLSSEFLKPPFTEIENCYCIRQRGHLAYWYFGEVPIQKCSTMATLSKCVNKLVDSLELHDFVYTVKTD